MTHVLPLVSFVFAPLFVPLNHVLSSFRGTMTLNFGCRAYYRWFGYYRRAINVWPTWHNSLSLIVLTVVVFSWFEIRYSIGCDLYWRPIVNHLGLSRCIGVVKWLLLAILILTGSWSTIVFKVRSITFVVWSVGFRKSVFLIDNNQIFVNFCCCCIYAVWKYISQRSRPFDITWLELNWHWWWRSFVSLGKLPWVPLVEGRPWVTLSKGGFGGRLCERHPHWTDRWLFLIWPGGSLIVRIRVYVDCVWGQQLSLRLPVRQSFVKALIEIYLSLWWSFRLTVGKTVLRHIRLTHSQLLLLYHSFLKFQPVRSVFFFSTQHELKHCC